MFRRLFCAALFCGLASGVIPVCAAGIPPRPTHIGYKFAHGLVTNARGIHLDLVIHTEDPFVPSNNGDYHVVFDARMQEYVVATVKGVTQISTLLTQPTTQVNGSMVLNAIPPTYNPQTKTQNIYTLLVSPNGICDCSLLPALIYSIAGNVPHHIYLGDLFSYLHPYLPTDSATLKSSWKEEVALGLTPHHLQPFTVVAALAYKSQAWNVVSHLEAGFRLSEPVAQWQKEWGTNWQDPLPYGGPVTVSGSFGIDSTLTLGMNDGIDVVPPGTKIIPGLKNKIKTIPCLSCTGYTMPLNGVETLHMLYTQGGHELQKVDIRAALGVSIVLNS